MKRPPRATLRKIHMPHIAPGCVRFEADCRYSTSGITHVPGPLTIPDEHIVLAVGYLHEERCGRCSVEDILSRGDQQLRQVVDDEWDRFAAMMAERMMRGRRN